ncbi:MAG: 4Fe-4S dicluster domain-containing protein [bacterium]|jgi:ferredoxin|nr:4Fe-4S dicluster domain-containing protein [bacterium]
MIRWGACLVAAGLVLPLPWGAAQGAFLWASPLLLATAWLAAFHVVAWQVLGLAVGGMSWIKPRWFCRFLCPTGALCDAAAACGRPLRPLATIPALQKTLCLAGLILAILGLPLLALLDPLNLFSAFFDLWQPIPAEAQWFKASLLLLVVCSNLILPHAWCQRVCPLGGLQDSLTDARAWLQRPPSERVPFMSSRRAALTALVAAGGGVWLRPEEAVANGTLRPPGARPGAAFQRLCARCGNCVKSCPTRIIQSSGIDGPIWDWLTPQICFVDSYCLPECNRCGAVCPSGAIAPFTPEQKSSLVLGTAVIDLERCLLTEGRECDRCKAACPYDAVAIVLPADAFFSIPQISPTRCVGCGACAILCPVLVITIAPLHPEHPSIPRE